MACPHHYVLEPPTVGEVSRGVCLHCGALTVGNNYGIDADGAVAHKAIKRASWKATKGKFSALMDDPERRHKVLPR